MIPSTQIANTKIFAFVAVVIFNLLSHKVSFTTEKTIETVKKQATFYQNSKFNGQIAAKL